MGKVNNALKMLAILRSINKVTRKELAQELEVEIREISRYKDDLESAVNKIKAASPKDNIINHTVKTNDKSSKAKIEDEIERKKWLTVNDGIINNKKLSIKYQNAQGKYTERIIRSYALFTYYEAIYCIAFCEEKKN